MALIGPSSTCAICKGPLDRPYTATSGLVVDMPLALLKFCDAPLHFDCLEVWPHRAAFSEAWYEARVPRDDAGPHPVLIRTARFALVAGPALPGADPHYVEVLQRDWPVRLYSRWAAWNEFVKDGFKARLLGASLSASEMVMETVRSAAPDLAALTILHRQRTGQ